MGLLPLEFTDCLTDSPYFRENLRAHEHELETTSRQIKGLIKEVNNVLNAAKSLSRAQRTLSESLLNFNFECIGNSMTDDELVISTSLRKFGHLIASIEDERARMLEQAYGQIVEPLEYFRKEHIGGVKEGKKKFEKQTLKFCQSQERYLNLSTKKQDTVLQEADATLEMEQRHFCQASLQYVCLLQQVQERKKFEFVETLLSFMYGWLTFYHQGHEVACDFKPFMQDLQFRIQKTRENFNATRDKTESLMKKMLESPVDSGAYNKLYTRQGYLYLMEKKAFGTTWTKQYCMYQKDTKEVTLIPYNQISGKINTTETFKLSSCVRRISDSIDKRFCFDITAEEKPGVVYTLQALSEDDRKKWMDVMGGKEPEYTAPGMVTKPEERILDDFGFAFVTKCIEALESRGLEEQGLYRVVGVSSKVTKLLNMGLDRRRSDKFSLDDEWESKTITSALKTYLRNLPEPLMTFRLHSAFIAAAKQENITRRVNDVHFLVHRIPQNNFNMLELLVKHLINVANHSDKNLMTVSNLAVCFGPTLLRPEEETVAAIMDIKFCNVVVEILIENSVKIFQTKPDEVDHSDGAHAPVQNTQVNRMTNSFAAPVPKPEHSQNYLRNRMINTNSGNNGSKFHSTPPVTHTVIKSYCDGPLSASLHNVHQNPGGIAVHGLHQGRGPPDMRGRTTNTGSEGNLLMMSQSPPRHSPPLHNQIPSSLPQQLKKKNTFFYPQGNMLDPSSQTQDIISHSEGVPIRPSQVVDTTKHCAAVLPSSGSSTASGVRSSSPSCANSTVRRVRTLYACLRDNAGELSFDPNQIITNVRKSQEPGWLEGTLNGKTGLIPENYVEFLP